MQDKKRYGVVLLTGGGDGSINSALSTVKCLLNHMDVQFVDFVCSHNTNIIPASEDNNALDKIEKVVTGILKGYL